MSRKIDNYFKKNRSAFYEAEPPEHIWRSIEKELFKGNPQKKKFLVMRIGYLTGIAATIIIVFTAGFMFWKYNHSKQSVNPDISAVQHEYIRMINSKKEELYQLKKTDPVMYADFIKDIDDLEANYLQLKNNLNKGANPDETMMAMMVNLQAQMDALNQQLQVIEKLKNFKRKGNETQDI